MRKTFILVMLTVFCTSVAAETSSLKSEEEYREDSQRICYDEWSTRGELDRRMFNHCMGRQTEAYRELVHLHQYADQSFYSETSFPYCRKEWTSRGVTNVRMKVHCLKREVEGIKDVMYFREQYGESQVNAVVRRALSRFGSWRMAAHQVKRQFE